MKDKRKNTDFILKITFVVLGVVVVFLAIIASWLWNLFFDPSNFDLAKWANRAIFNTSVSLIMMVLGFIAINESLKARENGKYNLRVEAFNDLVNQLFSNNTIVYFDQFLIWYSSKQLRDKKIKYLTRHGISVMDAQILVDNATLDDIPTLTGLHQTEVEKKIIFFKFKKKSITKPIGKKGEDIIRKDKDGRDILISAVNDTLAPYLEEVLNGTIYVDVEDSSYYTTIDRNKDSNLTSLERAQHTEKDRVKSLRTSFVSKGLMGIIYATLLALLVVDLNKGAGEAEAIWNLLARICAATLGFITGGFAGITNVTYLYKEMGDKMKVDMEYKKYLDTKEFIPKTYDQILKEKLMEKKELGQLSKEGDVQNG